ncbi:hypothetical protein OBBRIDRAFT_786857 [Obba rivulosa]|uniref:Sulfite efflux pump SSU1 n=1 Tax=Obba rivulosa TaxID=1052685 RepID=A0A8E2AL45_9APHY|nr:hypothetical protein OBBRIDRAFT_786857 [Obba rivulosa]
MQLIRPYAEWKPWKERIRHVTWSWHAVIMGTGVVSSLLHNFPYHNSSVPLQYTALGIDFLNMGLFAFVCSCTVLTYILFPEIWPIMLSDPTQSLYIGCFPMGAATLVNAALAFNQLWGVGGRRFLYVLWGLWWLDTVIALMVAFGMVCTMVVLHEHNVEKMTPVWLLPVVPLSVASSSGGLMANALKAHSTSFSLLTSTFFFGMLLAGLPLAVMIIAVYVQRLIVYGLPSAPLILSAFIVLGPMGQGGWSLLLNGQNVSELLPLHDQGSFPQSLLTGQMLFASCFSAAFMLWSMGICWIIITCFSVAYTLRKTRVPLSMAYWGLIFPNGAYSLLCVQLGNVLGSPFFRGVGAVWSCITMAVWLGVFICSIPSFIDGSIFNAAYLRDFPESEQAGITISFWKEGSEETAVNNTRATGTPAPSTCTSVHDLISKTDIANALTGKLSPA